MREPTQVDETLAKALYKGEAEAISLARELEADWVLIDERKASRGPKAVAFRSRGRSAFSKKRGPGPFSTTKRVGTVSSTRRTFMSRTTCSANPSVDISSGSKPRNRIGRLRSKLPLGPSMRSRGTRPTNDHRNHPRIRATTGGVQTPAGAVERAGGATRFVWDEFLCAEHHNPHTQAAYVRAVKRFLAWCEG